MPPRPLLVIAPVLLLGAGLALLRTRGSLGRVAGDDADDTGPRAPRMAERPPPTPPASRLRSLPDTPFGAAPSFATVEAWAGALSDAELMELLDEVGMDEHTGLTGWLRCALYAEWGRRDPLAASASLHDRGGPASRWDYPRSQAWFSVYRGWAEIDPEAALARLDAIAEQPETAFGFDDTARRKARTSIYRELARRHPDELWDLARQAPEGPRDPVVMQGLLEGAGDSLPSLVGSWTETVWREPVTLEALKGYHNMLNSSFSGFVPRPPAEQIARETALTLAEHRFEDGLAWVRDSDLGLESDTLNRIYGFHDDWARRHPREALDRIAANADPERNRVLAYGALMADPSLGPAILSHFEKPNERWDILFTAMSSGSNHHVDDFYPAPGQPNALRDFEANYRVILETVETAELPAERRDDLLKRIHQEFCRTVPAAAEAVADDAQGR